MISMTDDFFNKVVTEIDETYFPEIKYYRDNNNCAKVHYTVELFNNGCLTYRQLVGRVAKSCNDTTENLHRMIEKYIVSFGSYNYKPFKN